MTEPIMLTVTAAMQQSGVSKAQLYRWLADGSLAAVKNGRRTYVIAESLRQKLADLPAYTSARKVTWTVGASGVKRL